MGKTINYKCIEGGSLSPVYYLYMGNYMMARTMGFIVTFIIITSALIIGKLTSNYEIPVICYAFSFGSLIYNYRILHLLNKCQKKGYFAEGVSDKYYNSLKRLIGPMIILSNFCELYSVFFVNIFVTNTLYKIVASILIIALISIFKISNNLIGNNKFKIIVNNSVPELVLAILANILIRFNIAFTFSKNLILIVLAFVMGILVLAFNKKLREFFVDENKNLNKKDIKINVGRIRGLFNLEIFSDVKKEDTIKEEKTKTAKKNETYVPKKKSEYLTDEEIAELDEDERIKNMYYEYQEKKDQEFKKRQEELKRKKEKEAKLAEIKKKETLREDLTKEEKNLLNERLKETKPVNKYGESVDRANIKR